MSVLDTFVLLFKSDTSDLKKGSDEARKIVSNLTGLFSKAIPAFFSIHGIQSAVSYGVELSKTSRLLGINTQNLQAWRNAVELAGGDASQFESTLSSLAARFNTSSDVILKLLPRYADVLSRLSPQRAQQIGKNLGLDESTILLLQQGRREIELVINRQKQHGLITEQNTDLYLKYNRALIESKQSTQGIFNQLALLVIPVLTEFLKKLSTLFDYIGEHKDLVTSAFYAISAALAVMSARFIAASAAASPFLRILSAIVAASLVYEDVAGFIKGDKDTVTADILHAKNPEEFLKKLHDIRERSGFRTTSESQRSESLEQLKHFFQFWKTTPLTKNYVPNSPALRPNIHIGNITIETQATDAQGIASSLLPVLAEQSAQAANYFSDGVVA